MKTRFNIQRFEGVSEVADTACLLAARANGLEKGVTIPVLERLIQMEYPTYPRQAMETITMVGETDIHIDLGYVALAHIKLVEVGECPEAEELTADQARIFICTYPEAGQDIPTLFRQNPNHN